MKFLTSLMITLMLATSLLAQTPSATEAQAKQELNAAAQAYRAETSRKHRLVPKEHCCSILKTKSR